MTVHEEMLINQGTKKHRHQTLGRFPKLTSVQRAFPNLFLRAGVITPLLGKASLPLLGGIGNWFGPTVLLPLQLSDGVSGLESTPREAKTFADELELRG